MGRVATAKTGRERNYHCRLISLFHLTLLFQGYANIFVNRGTHVRGENDGDMHHEKFSRRVKTETNWKCTSRWYAQLIERALLGTWYQPNISREYLWNDSWQSDWEGSMHDSICLRATRALRVCQWRKKRCVSWWRKRVNLLLYYVTLIKFFCLHDANSLSQCLEKMLRLSLTWREVEY